MRILIIVLGLASIIVGIGGMAVYNDSIGPHQEGRVKLREAKMFMEQGTPDSLQMAVSRLTRLAARFGNRELGQEANYNLGVAYSKLGLLKEAYVKFRSLYNNPLLHDQDLRERVHFQLGKLQIVQNFSDEGLARLINILRTSQKPELRARVYYELGQYYLKAGKFKKARSSFEFALMEDPMLHKARIGLARSYGRMGKHAVAYELYANYKEGPPGALDPDSKKYSGKLTQGALAKGLSLFKQGKYTQAMKYFNVVFGKSPDSAGGEEAAYHRALALFRLKDYQNARKGFQETLANSPKKRDALSTYYLGKSYYLQKSWAKAVAWFDKFLNGWPQHYLVKKVQGYKTEAEQELVIQSEAFGDPYSDPGDFEPGDEEPTGNFFNESIPGDYGVSGQSSFPINGGQESGGPPAANPAKDEDISAGF